MRDLLFKRYGDPLALLGSYDLTEACGFIYYLFEVDVDEQLETIWLHKGAPGQTFKQFKAEAMKAQRVKPTRHPTQAEEQARILEQQQYIKPISKK